MAKRNNPLLAEVGDGLSKLLRQYTVEKTKSTIYDESAKTVDLTKLIPQKDLAQILERITTNTGIYDQTFVDKFFDMSLGRIERYSDYEQIVQRIPEVSQALHMYVDSILSPDVGDNELEYNLLDDTDDAKSAMELLKIVLEKTKFNKFLPQIIYTTCLYGDSFIEVERTNDGVRYIQHSPKNVTILHDKKTDIELGIIIENTVGESKLVDLLSYNYPSIEINLPTKQVAVISDKKYLCANEKSFEVQNIEKQIMELLKDIYKNANAKYVYLPPHKYVKFSIYYTNDYYPYGTSIIDSVRSVAKSVLLAESSLAIYRAIRTPLRVMWGVEVAGTPQDKVPSLMQTVMDRVRRQKVLNNETTNDTLDSIADLLTSYEDYWTPKVNGQSYISAEPLNFTSDSAQGKIDDVEYLRKKLISALGIPPSYLAEEQGGSTRALLTLEDIRFSRTIKKYQSDINDSLTELANTCFILMGFPYYVNTLELKLPEPKTLEDNIRLENLDRRLASAQNLMEKFPNIPKLWVAREIIGFSDEELKDMNDCIAEQKKMKIFNEQNPGEITSDEEGGGFGGGGFGDLGGDSFGGDLGDDNLGLTDEFAGMGGGEDFETPTEDLNTEMEETTNQTNTPTNIA